MTAFARWALVTVLGLLGAGVAVVLTAGTPEAPVPGDEPVRRDLGLGGPAPATFDLTALRAPPVGDPPPILVHGSGWGHGVGMSQYGAQAQALDGRAHAEILAYYYPGTRLQSIPEPDEPIRVNLFLNRGDLDRSRLVMRTSSRDGGPPDRPVEVHLGGGEPVEVPWPGAWELTADGGELVLTDNRGEERRRGAGPARVRYAFDEGNPTLLRLPQLIPRTSSSRLSGTFAWGELEVHHAGGRLQPVVVAPLERYLYGIAEVPSAWAPAALAAQAVTARTYAVRQMREPLGATCRCHLGATPHHQVYAGYLKEGAGEGHRWREAVDATSGEVLMFEGELAWTFYSSSHGGRSEHSEDSWAYAQSFPYLRSVDDPWSLDERVDNPFASWSRRIANDELAALVPGVAEVRGLRVLERTAGDSPRLVEVRGLDPQGVEVRVRWAGGDAGSAATALKRRFGARLPSQQIRAIGLEPFHDDAGLPGEYELVVAHRAGLVRGCEEGAGRVCPGEPVRRGELAVALTRAAEATGTGPDLRALLSAPDEERALEAATDAGLLEPCPGGCPDDTVTRAAAAAALAAAADLPPANPPADAVEHPQADAIGAVAAAGLVEPCEADAFCPDEPLTRHDLAVALVRAFLDR